MHSNLVIPREGIHETKKTLQEKHELHTDQNPYVKSTLHTD